jgi:DNA anti-recombination protein RmuC
LRIETEVLRARLKTEEAVSAEREQALSRAREQLQGVFGELARDSLQSNSEVFLQLARERLARQQQDASQALKERETAIESLVQPIREALAKTEAQIQTIERDRIDSFATLKTQMEALALGQTSLSRETRNLVTALRRPNVRGQWGEITLRRLVELSGMTSHVDFTEQVHLSTDSGAVRPDMVVHMPEQRDIVVDVKTPLDAYLAAVEAQDDEERGTQLRRHAQIVGARSRAVLEAVLVAIRTQPGFRGFVPARRSISVGGAARKSRIGRRFDAAKRHARHSHQSDRTVESRLPWLEANDSGRERRGDSPPRRGFVQAAVGVWRTSRQVGKIPRQ